MATVTISKRSGTVAQSVTGSFTSDGSAQVLALGFVPSFITVINETDTILWEKWDPMVAANSLKCVNNAATQFVVDTTSQILFNSDGTVTLGATLVGTSKAIKFYAGI
jgi:hypothetical protein